MQKKRTVREIATELQKTPRGRNLARFLAAYTHAKSRKSSPRGILYEGPSPYDGSPIVAILTSRSRNSKTGNMLQVWVVRTDVDPVVAKAAGLDRAVCGTCPVRKGCYVRVSDAPLSVFRAYKRGAYKPIAPSAVAGWAIRWGAYGDPAFIPRAVVDAFNAHATHWTGYTHQWRKPWGRQFRGVFMASVESETQEKLLRAEGWGTFRTGRMDGKDRGTTRLCESERTGKTCLECKLCDGRAVAIYIPAHGPLAGHVPAEAKHRLAVLQPA